MGRATWPSNDQHHTYTPETDHRRFLAGQCASEGLDQPHIPQHRRRRSVPEELSSTIKWVKRLFVSLFAFQPHPPHSRYRLGSSLSVALLS